MGGPGLMVLRVLALNALAGLDLDARQCVRAVFNHGERGRFIVTEGLCSGSWCIGFWVLGLVKERV